ncbi:LptA/OstA family protein [Alteraurantiacibacter aquimixticola]|uniref:OstA family protein n=1 Tax=Alteraurantiacibacter aquimixticola TaxID=2489173 RepID=A0A4T3EWX9_9SPHN|nr:LptA/OstA family protein [Alteraurantiacibacter aquimixticola]TIX48958.1 OstA family protein [Alteraurantiacibacter aquimixticola]
MSATRPTLGKLALRGLVAGSLAGSIAALSFGSVAGAQNIAGFDSNQPVSYDAGHIDILDRQNRVVLSGGVVIQQGNLQLRADRTTVSYTSNGGLTIQRLDATGNVVVSRGNERASGAAGVYDFNRRVIILSGGVALRRGNDSLNGGRLVIDLNSGISSVDGNAAGSRGEGGRVSGTFTVPDQN